MYYCTRYYHNPDKETLYYAGNGTWEPIYNKGTKNARCLIRFYKNQDLAKLVINEITEGDWHYSDIVN